MTAKRTDANQIEIVKALRKAGATVCCAHTVGHGFPDLVISFRGSWLMAEVKMPKGKLTRVEREFHETHQAPVYILRSIDDALRMLEGVE